MIAEGLEQAALTARASAANQQSIGKQFDAHVRSVQQPQNCRHAIGFFRTQIVNPRDARFTFRKCGCYGKGQDFVDRAKRKIRADGDAAQIGRFDDDVGNGLAAALARIAQFDMRAHLQQCVQQARTRWINTHAGQRYRAAACDRRRNDEKRGCGEIAGHVDVGESARHRA